MPTLQELYLSFAFYTFSRELFPFHFSKLCKPPDTESTFSLISVHFSNGSLSKVFDFTTKITSFPCLFFLKSVFSGRIFSERDSFFFYISFIRQVGMTFAFYNIQTILQKSKQKLRQPSHKFIEGELYE